MLDYCSVHVSASVSVKCKCYKLTWNDTLGLTALVAFSILLMLSAAFTGTVLFSTIILCPSLTAELIERAADSIYFKSAARPYKTKICCYK